MPGSAPSKNLDGLDVMSWWLWDDGFVPEGPPSGTVTFLFTDIEGSTRLWFDHPEPMVSALAQHDATVRVAVESRGGTIFAHTGDGFAAAFWTSDAAIEAAQDAQSALMSEVWPEPLVIRVRMGVHTGTASERAGDYFGPAVNRAARIMAAGHGGQVLISETAARLSSRSDLSDLGTHRLKDLPDPERIWQLGGVTFQPLRSKRDRSGNLPRPARSFVGRVADCKQLSAAVGPGHLVTLIGVGGVGKTRLALETATALRTEFADGAWWCDLAALDAPGSLVGAVAATLSIPLQAGMSPTESAVDWLAGRSMLVVLDNCEHLLESVAGLADAVLEGCSGVALLATSREPLGLDAEQVWPVRSLDPDLEGVQLFVERAVAADASFTPDDDRAVLVELCRHLDGIPLAIELAAAKVRAMSPGEVLDRLGDRFRLLRGGARGGMDRHRTLAATLDWSYGLLPPEHRRLLDCLCVFAGSFHLDAVKAVCVPGELDDVDALDSVSSLVDKSLVTAERHALGTRYRLLETVRQYAEGHAAVQGILAGLRSNHLDYYLGVAESAGADWRVDYTSGQVVFDREWDNLRAATHTALANGDSGSLGRIFTAIGPSVVFTLRYEVADWADAAAELPDAHVSSVGMAALLNGILGDYERCEVLARAAMAGASEATYYETVNYRIALYASLARSGQIELAAETVSASQRASMEAGDTFFDAIGSATYALRALPIDPGGVAAFAQRAEALIATSPNAVLRGEVLSTLSRYYSLIGEHSRAIECCREGLALAEEHHLVRGVHHARNALAQLVARSGAEDPAPVLRAAIAGTYADRSWYDLWPTVPVLAEWWAAHNQPDDAAVVIGFLEAHHLASVDDTTRSLLGTGPDMERALARGVRLNRDQLIGYILEHLSTRH
jgi:predicted ATPase/class 3 adenylate cyclase